MLYYFYIKINQSNVFRKVILLLNLAPSSSFQLFKIEFLQQLKSLKQIEINKSIIENKISETCAPMNDFLSNTFDNKSITQLEQSEIRANLRSQQGYRLQFKNRIKKNKIYHINQIDKTKWTESNLRPQTRMKWKSPQNNSEKSDTKQFSVIGSNNIDLLCNTIPELQNSIRRLSLKKSPQTFRSRELQMYSTVESKMYNRRPKFISRLF